MVALLAPVQLEGRDVVQHRFLRQVIADHVGHVRIDRLVVGHPGADRVGERDAAPAVGGEEAGDAQHRVAAERERVEEIVVDAPVDHVHALGAARRLHVDRIVAHEQVLALDQFDAHLLREERVLEVRGVPGAGGQDRDGRLDVLGREAAQVVEQDVRIMLDRTHRLRREELGQEPHHHLAVLEHVRDAGGHAQVVLEHVELALARPDDVDARDVRVDPPRHVDAAHLGAVLGVREHALGRKRAAVEDPLVVVDVVEERVERPDALEQPALQHGPFVGADDPRDQVERDQPFGAGGLARDGERDAQPVERALGLVALLGDPRRRRPRQPVGNAAVMRPDRSVRSGHFVVRGGGHRGWRDGVP